MVRRLASAGLFHLPDGVRTFEAAALEAGVGFTDIVKRPTVGEKNLGAGELEHGRSLLASKLGELDVPLVVCVLRQPVEALIGRSAAGGSGLQEPRTSWGSQVFRMPGRGPNWSQCDPWRGFKYRARATVLERAGGRCEGSVLLAWGRCADAAVEVVHVFPYSKGGPTVVSNGQALCRDHNRRKGSINPPW